MVECRATVLQRGRRSVTIDTRLIAEDLLSGVRTDCLSGEFVMVRQAEDIEPVESARAAASTDSAEVSDPASALVAEIVFPGHANHRSLLHGGPAMEWMAKAGFVAATRQVRRTVIMAASEKLDFRASAHVGEVVEVTACVLGVGRRSVQVQVEMWAEAPSTGERRHCTSGRLVFVAVE